MASTTPRTASCPARLACSRCVLLTSVLYNEWGFRGWIVTDSASSAGSYMDASQMIEAGGVSKLAQAENLAKWTFDQNDPAEYHCAREVMHALL